MNYIHEEMIKLGADGVIFHGIGLSGNDVFKNVVQEYSIDVIEYKTAIPRCDRTYYKLINGKKVLYDKQKQTYVDIIEPKSKTIESKTYKVLFKDVDSHCMHCETYDSQNEADGRYLMLAQTWDYVELIEEIKTMNILRRHGELLGE